ncbi:hypothetical protein HGG71_13805 [Rhodobacteraceae bacterium R_SAG2]|nr:hypothetical protein [Rhodobacteraceae bacterium R_SAG2]
MQSKILQAPAIIGGQYYPAGTSLTATDEAIVRGIARAAKVSLRKQIEDRAGDALSLLGTLSDVSGVMLAHVVADVIAISENPGNEGQRRRLEIMQALAGDDDIVALAKDALARISSGDAVLTSSVKGLPAVLDEVLGRATETAAVLRQAVVPAEQA